MNGRYYFRWALSTRWRFRRNHHSLTNLQLQAKRHTEVLRQLSVPRPRPAHDVRYTEDRQACTPSKLSVALIRDLHALVASIERGTCDQQKGKGWRARFHAFNSRSTSRCLLGRGLCSGATLIQVSCGVELGVVDRDSLCLASKRAQGSSILVLAHD